MTRTAAPVEDRRTPVRGQAPPASAPSTSTAPGQPDWRPQSYTVKRGDTLQAIALEHGLDYRELAAWNGIDNPNLIRVGQVLRLRAPGDAGGTTETTAMSDPVP
jgi:lipoprotein NlpD